MIARCGRWLAAVVWLALVVHALVLPARAQDAGQEPPAGGTGPRRGASTPAIRPYAEIIPPEAQSQDGMFRVHRVGERLYYEIPTAMLGREMLWVTTFARTQTGYGYAGTEVQNRVVRWVRRGDKILLRAVDYQLRAEAGGAVRRAVEASALEPILQAIDIRALGPNDAPVIEVTPLFTTDISEFSGRRQLNAQRLDTSRTFLERVKAFPRNIETWVLATYVAGATAPTATPLPQRPIGPQRDRSTDAVTVELHHSLVLLPDQPMKPRLHDSRVGYFSGRHFEFSRNDHRVVEVRYIRRWRLEKRDPGAPLSEPVRPIVYYIGREVPEKWRPWIKRGVEDWQVAFEAAGFKNAIIARDAPSEAEDPDWDPEDVRYATIRWLPATIENAYGPHIADPRTGEILDADIKFYHDILKLLTAWYFVQASPCDPRAQKLPFPDDLMGELIRYVTAHEVGHTLGLQHNMKASSAFTVEQLRDPAFTRKWGTEASIMDYGRFNYVAQPGDGAHLIPKIGPYDIFAIEWGYRPIPNAATPDDEKRTLDEIAARQVSDPTLRFGDASSDDPARRMEDLGSDPVAATRLGLRNLDRVLDYLVEATCKPGEDYSLLREMYDRVVGQRNLELGHVAAVVGGVYQTNYHYGRGGLVYTPVPAEKQAEAVQFLLEHCFETPKGLLRSDILGRIEPSGAMDRVLSGQQRILESLLSDDRAKRMTEQAALNGGRGYTVARLVADLRAGIWRELEQPRIAIDPFRRNLQRAFIRVLGSRIAGESSSQTDLRAAARGTLVELRAAIAAALPKAAEHAIRLHLEDCAAQIAALLEPK